MEKVAYLGPSGSYSHVAAKKLREGANLIPFTNFYAIMRALDGGEVDYAVCPVQNSLNGAISQNLDLLQAHNCVAIKEYTLKIEHRLATIKGADKNAINRIYSHSQALEQCAKFLADNYPNAKLVAVSSTSQGANMVKLATDAAIASADCGVEGLEFSKESIADQNDNFTHFLLIKRGLIEHSTRSSKIYFSATCPHRPGALVEMLSILAKNNINMSKIESRPIKDKLGEFRFFIEIEGDYALDTVKSVLNSLKSFASSFKLLGVY